MNSISTNDHRQIVVKNCDGCHRESDDETLKMRLYNGTRLSGDQLLKTALDILDSDKEEMANKVFAVQNLKRVQSPAAEDSLLRVVSKKDPALSFSALNTLSLTGTRKTFAALSRLSSMPFGSLERQKDFAMLLIGYREQIPGTEKILERLQEGATSSGKLEDFPIRVQTIRGNDIAEVLRQSRAAEYGITLSRNVAFSMKAGDQTYYFCFSNKFDNPAEWQDALRTKQVVGQLLMQDQFTKHVSRQYIALATPMRDHVQLSIFRNDGKLFMLARVNHNREGNSFTVSNIDEEKTKRAEKNDFSVDRNTAVTMNLAFIRHHRKKNTTGIESDFQLEKDESG